jgi:hypothetical protein
VRGAATRDPGDDTTCLHVSDSLLHLSVSLVRLLRKGRSVRMCEVSPHNF